MSKLNIINCDCLDLLPSMSGVDCIFADPPDNIGLKYASHNDKLHEDDYDRLMRNWIHLFVRKAPVVWLSFNAKHTRLVAVTIDEMVHDGWLDDWTLKPCIQTFTFGQHNNHDLGKCYRPLWRLMAPDAKLYPDEIRVESERQKMGDKRANPAGRVPSDVFDFPRVTGNSKQRRSWHPTQLHEGLVERCIKLTTKPGDLIVDPFAGTGTTGRVCQNIGRDCLLIEIDQGYCDKMSEEFSE